MPKSQLKVTNITNTSTETAWSQTYHAGGVTAVIAVRQKDKSQTSLSIVGKDLLNTFESEYFTLETKNLASIKSAVELTYNKSKDTHDISLIVSAVIQNAVYVVLAGKGKILLIRHNTLATLLEQTEGEDVISASGFLEPDDVMILETPEFAEHISSSMLLETCSSNSVEVASEIISPEIHKEKNGAQAAVLFSYHETAPIAPLEKPKELEKIEAKVEKEDPETAKDMQPLPAQAEKPTATLKEKKQLLSHRQKIFLTIAIVLVLVLVSAVYFSLQKKQTTQNTTLFSSVYPPAERKYEEGLGLKDLNAPLAQSDFQEAQKMLNDAKTKFPSDSSEEKQILALLSKVDKEITPSSAAPTTEVTKAVTGDDTFMDFVSSQTSANYFAQDDSNYYFADNTGITKVSKTSKKQTQIIKNGGDWKSVGGFATYLGNMYVLDSADGVDKYAVTASGFGNKAAYFSTAPDLSKAVSMAIDGSIWILTSDGKVSQYTKGKAVSFAINGLTTPLSSPTQIVTNSDDDNLYILDNGNSRIVVIKKDTGAFVAEYHNDVLKKATQLDAQEKDKTAFILSSGTIYKMELK